MNSRIEEIESQSREDDDATKEKVATLHKMKNQWSRRRQGKQEDLESVEKDYEVAVSNLNDEQQKAMKLRDEASATVKQCSEEKLMMKREGLEVRKEYALLLASIEKVNVKMTGNFKKLEAASAL